jgi:glycosyltransferase involved in cell wall biosynthesis
MKIAIDLRSLSSGTVSGVENYCVNLVESLLRLDRQNQYALFYNALRASRLPDFHYVNSKVAQSRIPGKILNLALMFNWQKIEKFAGEADWFFMPNLNQFSISHKTKLAITVHDLSPVVTPEFYNLKRKVWHHFLNYKKAFERANVLFAVSEYTKNDLIRIFNVDPNKIKVVYPGINHQMFNQNITINRQRHVRNIYSLPGDYILFLNTIEPRKNLAGVISAFEKINAPASLVIAGRLGWKYKKDFQLINKSKKSAKIRYVGYMPEQDKPALIKMAKVLVYPSFYEGFGFQPLEAMAVGTPVVASHLTSLPEIVGDAGLLCDPYNSNSLASALDQILSNDKFREILIQKGFAQAGKFNWERTAGKVLGSFYDTEMRI